MNKLNDSEPRDLNITDNKSQTETRLDNLIIRDASEQEKAELKIIAEESIMNMAPEAETQVINRCSLLELNHSNQKVPRDGIQYSGIKQDDSFTFQSARSSREEKDGFQTNRSSSSNSAHQLTGLKPKALIFESPEKQTPTTKQGAQSVFGTTSTKEQTGSGIGFGVSGGFGGIKLMQCE